MNPYKRYKMYHDQPFDRIIRAISKGSIECGRYAKAFMVTGKEREDQLAAIPKFTKADVKDVNYSSISFSSERNQSYKKI